MKRIAFLAAAASLILFGCSEDLPTGSGNNGVAEIDAPATTDEELLPYQVDDNHGVPRSIQTYEITVENLTPATGAGARQPFSPPVLATHRRDLRIFRPGSLASDELAQVAEDAVSDPLVAFLENSDQTNDVVTGDGVILPGAQASYEIQAAAGKRRLSAVFMLVNTNDGFGGLDGVQLPLNGEKVYYVRAWDAGSEENTELATDIPGPCCGSPGQGTPTSEPIRLHAGIHGGGDLDPNVYGWDDPVARVTIRRIAPTWEITLENMTPATVPGGSQPFSPPIIASHRPGVRMFRVGSDASDELSHIAEDGDTGPMAEFLGRSRHVHSVVTGDAPLLPGTTATYQIESGHAFARLSIAFMLVNTNDAFSGVDRLRLPAGGSASYYLGTYDAGTEQNTELASDIPGPCCGNPGQGTDEYRQIRHHNGITGDGDLDAADYGWSDPTAKLTITRVK